MTLPLFISGLVVKGFGRGSKELGIPTANFADSVVNELPKETACGVYYGWASVNRGPVHKMVMSIGWNPVFRNVKKSVETHILHRFEEDFYGSLLQVAILGYLRPEKTFDAVDQLVEAIRNDIDEAKTLLDTPECLAFKSHDYFRSSSNGHSL